MAALSPTFTRNIAVAACVAAAAAALALGPAGSGSAAPKPSKAELKAELAKLNKKVDGLIEQYGAKRAELAKAQKAERAASERLDKAETAFESAKRQVGDIARFRYQVPEASVSSYMFGGDAGGAALLEQLAEEDAAHLSGYADALDARKRASDQAAALTEKLRGQAEDVDRRRKEAEALIGRIERKLDQLVPAGSGRRSDGSWAPQLPTGADNITPRTRIMRDEVLDRFPRRFGTGCYRVDNFGEHPLGRACDFMLSSGGSMPSGDMAALGDRISEWAIQNGGKIGVKYVIYKQRIYNLGSPGWRAMGNRGSITQNHFDHVHISMY